MTSLFDEGVQKSPDTQSLAIFGNLAIFEGVHLPKVSTISPLYIEGCQKMCIRGRLDTFDIVAIFGQGTV